MVALLPSLKFAPFAIFELTVYTTVKTADWPGSRPSAVHVVEPAEPTEGDVQLNVTVVGEVVSRLPPNIWLESDPLKNLTRLLSDPV